MERFTDLLSALPADLPRIAEATSDDRARSTIMRPIAADYPNLLAFPRSRSEHSPLFAHST